jgi:hypothetical protein
MLFFLSMISLTAEQAPELLTEYAVPQYFPVDYFSVLDGTEHRPSYRWLLIGPKRSGSPFHKV